MTNLQSRARRYVDDAVISLYLLNSHRHSEQLKDEGDMCLALLKKVKFYEVVAVAYKNFQGEIAANAYLKKHIEEAAKCILVM